MSKSFKVELARFGDEGGICSAWIEADENGSVRVERFDTGPAPRNMLGGDYERTVEVFTPDGVAKLCTILLGERFKDRIDALDAVAALCKEHGIPYDDRSWS